MEKTFEIERTESTKINVIQKLNSSEEIVAVINEGICELQGVFPQYLIVASEKHKKLHKMEKEGNIKKIKECYDDLINYLNSEVEKACQITEKYLLRYFKGRSKYNPRICIKIPHGYNGEKIIDLYRRSYSTFPEFNVEDNTAFAYFKSTGKFYVCNNIPEATKKGEYKNLRINVESVKRSYKPPGFIKKIWYKYRGQPEHDETWRGFWKDSSKGLPSECFYKSTLVTPMTLINAPLSYEFLTLIFDASNRGEKIDIREKYKKLAFGFICIDHRHYDYFYPEIDARVGYIFADFLSLFLIVRLLFTRRSKTFAKVEKMLREHKNERKRV